VQKFTGWGIATPEWKIEAIRRVTAFFSSPNAVGLYLAPVFILMLTLIVSYGREVKDLLRRPLYLGLVVSAIFCILAIIFTKSQGTWIGLGVGILVFLFFVGYKKVAVAMAIAGQPESS